MSEYDNTNTGAAFKPFDGMKLILQGKVNLEGNDRDIVLVTDTTKSGKKIIKAYQKLGVMFENDSDNERAPNYSGSLDDYTTNKEMQLAGWKREKDGNPYISMKISEKYSDTPNVNQSLEETLGDDIPF
mgnify:FL=1|tara:strand:- start:470 stop:856 length:387 start_codon:yes stop_codon:yes gene_type:complete